MYEICTNSMHLTIFFLYSLLLASIFFRSAQIASLLLPIEESVSWALREPNNTKENVSRLGSIHYESCKKQIWTCCLKIYEINWSN